MITLKLSNSNIHTVFMSVFVNIVHKMLHTKFKYVYSLPLYQISFVCFQSKSQTQICVATILFYVLQKKLQIKDANFLRIYYHTKLLDSIVLLPHHIYLVIIDGEIKKYRGGMSSSSYQVSWKFPIYYEVTRSERTHGHDDTISLPILNKAGK
jgi:hypothetical protein